MSGAELLAMMNALELPAEQSWTARFGRSWRFQWDQQCHAFKQPRIPSAKCEGVEDVQGVLTLLCSGAAQVVCHALRVVELKEQLEVEEEDGDRQEEEEEVESGEANQGECAMWMTMDGDMKVLRT